MGDIDIAVVDSLKVLDPRRPIREADIGQHVMCNREAALSPYQSTRLRRTMPTPEQGRT